MRRKAESGILITALVFTVMFVTIMGRYFVIAADRTYAETAEQRSKITIEAGELQGRIYDRNMELLVENEYTSIGVAVPQLIDREGTAVYAADRNDFLEKYDKGEPFTFSCLSYAPESAGLTVFHVPKRYSSTQAAQHVVGYLSQGEGADGIEYAYDSILRGGYGSFGVTYSVDGFGRVLAGEPKEVTGRAVVKAGVVTTIDSGIQRICEECGAGIRKGAIVLADVKTGDILALASFPKYSADALEEALDDSDSPLINRALYAYSAGSIFKLVTACEGIIEGYEGYKYNCTGTAEIWEQRFNCHKLDGHGIQTMTEAMVNSCNTYFIEMSRTFDVKRFRELAFSLGFGREIHLCSGMTASAGTLPTVKELSVEAELANFSFGQGKLTVTPLQILQMTCGIANGGEMPMLRLIKGITENGEDIPDEKRTQYAFVMEKETAEKLAGMMRAAVIENDSSNARPNFTTAGAKTSTAQTGRYDKNGEELCNAWITGFFPAYSPAYAVTVLIEDGGYGNDTAAPVFKKIADKVTKIKEKD